MNGRIMILSYDNPCLNKQTSFSKKAPEALNSLFLWRKSRSTSSESSRNYILHGRLESTMCNNFFVHYCSLVTMMVFDSSPCAAKRQTVLSRHPLGPEGCNNGRFLLALASPHCRRDFEMLCNTITSSQQTQFIHYGTETDPKLTMFANYKKISSEKAHNWKQIGWLVKIR